MDILMIVMRFIHIVAGVFWVGAAFVVVRFILPTASAAGPAGGQFMQQLLRSGFTRAVIGAGVLNVPRGLGDVLARFWRIAARLDHHTDRLDLDHRRTGRVDCAHLCWCGHRASRCASATARR